MENCVEIQEVTDHGSRIPRSGKGRDHRASQVVIQRNPCKLKNQQTLKIGTWNVKSLYESGKTHNAIKEMRRLQVDILGICEMRWPGSGERNMEHHKIYYTGNTGKRHENGVGIIVNNNIQSAVIGCIRQSDRIIMLKLRGTLFNINIVQVYAPTAEKSEEEIEDFYSQIGIVMKNVKKRDVTIVMGDFNAKVGEGAEDKLVGLYGLGQRNQRGDRLVQFCREEKLVVSNTFYKLPSRRLYTWKSPADKPGNIVRNQIDFILISERFRNSMTSVKTYPGADVPSDHNPLVGQLKTKLKKTRPQRKSKKYDIEKLKNPEIQEKVKSALTSELKDMSACISEPDKSWNTMETRIIEVNNRFLKPDTTRQKKKGWMTDEIMNLMEERRRVKSNNTQEYWAIHRNIRKKIREAKAKWMTEKCSEIEDLNKKHDLFNTHKKIKEVTGSFRQRVSGNVSDENGNIVLEINDMLRIWKKYTEHLFDDEQRPEKPIFDAVEGPHITISEVKQAIKLMKNGKAMGPDEIPSEIFKIMEEDTIETLTALFNKIYDTGIIPERWLASTFITLPKKSNAKSCEDFRTISLMCHVLKIFLKIIHARIYKKCEENNGETQFGFRNGLGTREALFAIQVLIQRCRDVNCDVYVCFLDYTKAFDRCQHEKLLDLLTDIGLDGKDIRIIANLYWGQKATVRVDNRQTEYIDIKRGVRQGCILSPLLFNLYSNSVFKEALENTNRGIRVNGEIINNIRYADDTVLLSDSIEGLQELLNKVNQTSEVYGLSLNVNKTKYMVISKNPIQPGNLLYINNKPIERKSKFTYLGCTLNENWDHSQEIKHRIEIARNTFIQMKPLLSCRDLNLTLKKRIVRCYIYSTLLYGVEAWTLSEAMERKLQAFEMWIFRRILRISWIQRITNEEVLRRMGCEPEIMLTVKRRKLEYFGHIMRNSKFRILQNIVQGKVDSRRGPGRRRISWLANLRKWFGATSTELFRCAANKIRIAMMIANVRNRIGQ